MLAHLEKEKWTGPDTTIVREQFGLDGMVKLYVYLEKLRNERMSSVGCLESWPIHVI